MPDEVGTETTRSDAPSVDDSLFGDATAADDKPAAAVEEEDSTDQTEQDGQGSDDAGEQDAGTEAAEDEQGSDDAGEETGSSDDLKVVVSIKGGRAVIGVQKPSADPAHRDLRRPRPDRAGPGGAGGDGEGQGQVGGDAQAPGLREVRSPAQASQPASAGDGAGRGRRGRDGPGTADTETLLGSLSAKHGGGRRNGCGDLPCRSIYAAFFAFRNNREGRIMNEPRNPPRA